MRRTARENRDVVDYTSKQSIRGSGEELWRALT
jgi:hypothetical protein